MSGITGGRVRCAIARAAAPAWLALVGSCGSTGPDPGAPVEPRPWEWRQAAPFGGPALWFSAAFTIDSLAYVGTGYGDTLFDGGPGYSLSAFWAYAPGTDTWRRRADFGGAARGASVAFAIGGRGYIGLGYGEAETRYADLWEYDPVGDRWTAKAALPGVPRDHAGAFVISGRAYVVGGMTCAGSTCATLREVWAYDPATDRWTRTADLPVALSAPSCFVVNGIGYVAEGVEGPAGLLSTGLWAYDPAADAWSRKAEFPGAARYRAVAFAMNGRGYVGTGLASVSVSAAVVFGDLWEYDPQADAWTRQADVAGPARGAAVAFTLGSRVFVGTGVGADRQLRRDVWSTAPAPPAGR